MRSFRFPLTVKGSCSGLRRREQLLIELVGRQRLLSLLRSGFGACGSFAGGLSGRLLPLGELFIELLAHLLRRQGVDAG